MKLILLSGGSGKRLWPLSNDSRSKQFLKVLPGPDGRTESMIQRVWRQLEDTELSPHAYLVTGKAQTEMILNQLGPETALISEPERRDTFAAIMLAVSYLLTHTSAGEEETVVVMPVDPYVETDFFQALQQLDREVQQGGAALALMGAKPSHPSEKYGYIVPEEKGMTEAAGSSGRVVNMANAGLLPVSRFVEKPAESAARDLLRQGALWNCGVFAAKLSYYRRLLQERGLPETYEELLHRYGEIRRISFDYEVVERETRIGVLPYEGFWKDLGTWNTLTEEMLNPINGKGTLSEDSRHTHIVNELDIPIAVLGVSNLIVAASPDGILVADKEMSPRMKEVVPDDGARPMYVERHWGWYRVLEYGSNEQGEEVLVRRVCLQEGKNLSYHYHEHRMELWTITSGSGEALIDGVIQQVGPGSVISIPRRTLHSIRAHRELQWIETQIGDALVEADIHRESLHWPNYL